MPVPTSAVPYPYNTKFADANATSPTPELWTAKEKLFASCVATVI